jgi:hypothetical protein
MSVGTTITASADVLLAERVAALARLLETHPAYHLLAEYEALFVDRHACAAETVPCLQAAADDLLARVNDVIATLAPLMVPAPRLPEDRRLAPGE